MQGVSAQKILFREFANIYVRMVDEDLSTVFFRRCWGLCGVAQLGSSWIQKSATLRNPSFGSAILGWYSFLFKEQGGQETPPLKMRRRRGRG